MKWSSSTSIIAQVLSLVATVSAQSACKTLTNSLPAPSVAPGYQVQLAMTGLKAPRGIQMDMDNHLLVVDRGVGIYRFSIDECLQLQDKKLLVEDDKLNHGIAVSADGKTLFASSSDIAYSWAYDSKSGDVTDKKELVTGMDHTDHVTRTLLAPASQPDMLIISIGSNDNIDLETQSVNSGRSQIRAFSIKETSEKSVVFSEAGLVLGYGLRNSVGLAEDGAGQLWSVENSADGIERDGKDVHQNNPGEELNFHGKLTDTYDRGSYGYPVCYAVWNATELPDNTGLVAGEQFSLNENRTLNDDTCAENYNPPRLTFQAHQAPLDIKFDGDGDGWISFHGSWNRDQFIGYKLVTVSFDNYQPTEPNSSTIAAHDVMSNADLSQCPGKCFRPVGLSFDSEGRLFMSSDSTGEIYVIRKENGDGLAPVSSMSMAPSQTTMMTKASSTFVVTSNGQVATVTGTMPSESTKPNAGGKVEAGFGLLVAMMLAQIAAYFL